MPCAPAKSGRMPWSGRGWHSLRLPRQVQGDGGTNEFLERGLVNLVSFMDVDGAADVAVKAGVEKTRRVLQRSALEKGELHDLLVGLAGADASVVRPDRSSPPL